MQYSDLTVTVGVILALLSSFVLVTNAMKASKEWTKPHKDLEDTVSKHTELLDSDNKRLTELEKNSRMQTRCMLALVNHEITGNDISGLKSVKKEMEDYLINK